MKRAQVKVFDLGGELRWKSPRIEERIGPTPFWPCSWASMVSSHVMTERSDGPHPGDDNSSSHVMLPHSPLLLVRRLPPEELTVSFVAIAARPPRRTGPSA